jgi:hypothetical protein
MLLRPFRFLCRKVRIRQLVICGVVAAGSACGSDNRPGLADFFPDLPPVTGEPQSVFAGPIVDAAELISGPASSGRVGDFYLRNSRARFVVQSAARVIGVVPQGGNLIDAVALDEQGKDASEDHFGELSLIYLVGRTCEHETVEVVRDGSAGGAAVLRAVGRSSINDYINLRGIGALPIPEEINPDIEDQIECATTYVLEPDSPRLAVYWSLFNPGDLTVQGPFGALADTGGETEVFAPTRGFERAGIEALSTLTQRAPIDYVVYQGPQVAYGLVPVHKPGEVIDHMQVAIAGVSVMVFGVDTFIKLLDSSGWFLNLEHNRGLTMRTDVVIGVDAAAAEAEFAAAAGLELVDISGQVAFASGATAPGARIGLFIDANENGAIDNDDPVRTYIDPAPDGRFSARVPQGSYLLRGEAKDSARSETRAVILASDPVTGLTVSLPDPVAYDYTIIDDETGQIIPGRISVVGDHPVLPDVRLFETADRRSGVVRVIHAVRGTTVDVGDGADPQLLLPAGGTYRAFASHGTEWSTAHVDLAPGPADAGGELTFRLRHVVPTSGYVATEFHQHSVGSPDSPVSRRTRLATFVAEGIEFFASTDHDFVTDFQPIIEAMGLERAVRSVPGVEITPFVYGHFQAFPQQIDPDDPSGGAVDWARGTGGFAMIPSEIWAAARDRGAEVIQINHPRAAADTLSDMQQYFDRTGLRYDYGARVIEGDPTRSSVPLEWMRLPGESIWSDQFNALELWNGNRMADTNGDGVRENASLDLVLRDWFNFLSFGLEITPIGNSDSHNVVVDYVGMPRTYVRVAADSADDLASGAVVGQVLDVLAGRVPRDVIVTNGPHLSVSAGAGSAIGAVVDGTAGSVALTIDVVSPDWAAFDTVEAFINATPDTDNKRVTAVQPAICFTSRPLDSLDPADPCELAPLPPQPLTVALVEVAPGFFRYQASVQLTVNAADIPLFNRAGASGGDAWVVIRVRGSRAIFPVMEAGAITGANLATLVTGDSAAVEAALAGIGVPATALTMATYLDLDGNGYRAPFAP